MRHERRPGLSERHSDAELLELVANAHREALGTLYERHAAAVRATAERITRDRGEAEDLLHDIFLEIWRTAGDYRPDRGSVRTWLLVRARSRSLDRCRRTRRPTGDEAHAVADVAGSPPSAEELTLQWAVTRLPHALRELLELGYYAGMSSSEIATTLEIPLGTVKSRVARALAELRVVMRDEVGAGARRA